MPFYVSILLLSSISATLTPVCRVCRKCCGFTAPCSPLYWKMSYCFAKYLFGHSHSAWKALATMSGLFIWQECLFDFHRSLCSKTSAAVQSLNSDKFEVFSIWQISRQWWSSFSFFLLNRRLPKSKTDINWLNTLETPAPQCTRILPYFKSDLV